MHPEVKCGSILRRYVMQLHAMATAFLYTRYDRGVEPMHVAIATHRPNTRIAIVFDVRPAIHATDCILQPTVN